MKVESIGHGKIATYIGVKKFLYLIICAPRCCYVFGFGLTVIILN